MKLDWSKVLSQAVAALVTLVFVGAAVQVYRGYASMDERIADAVNTVAENQTRLIATQEVIGPRVERLESKLETMAQWLGKLSRDKKIPGERMRPIGPPPRKKIDETLRERRERRSSPRAVAPR